MTRITSIYLIFILCCFFSCSTDDTQTVDLNSETESLILRGVNNGGDDDDDDDMIDCCDFEYDINIISNDGECCVYSVSIWVDYLRCPIYAIHPDGSYMRPGAKAYCRFQYDSCDDPDLTSITFQIGYDDEDAQVSRSCGSITLDLDC